MKKTTGYLNNLIRSYLADALIEFTIPEKPNSRLQKYRLKDKGRQTLDSAQNPEFTTA